MENRLSPCRRDGDEAISYWIRFELPWHELSCRVAIVSELQKAITWATKIESRTAASFTLLDS